MTRLVNTFFLTAILLSCSLGAVAETNESSVLKIGAWQSEVKRSLGTNYCIAKTENENKTFKILATDDGKYVVRIYDNKKQKYRDGIRSVLVRLKVDDAEALWRFEAEDWGDYITTELRDDDGVYDFMLNFAIGKKLEVLGGNYQKIAEFSLDGGKETMDRMLECREKTVRMVANIEGCRSELRYSEQSFKGLDLARDRLIAYFNDPQRVQEAREWKTVSDVVKMHLNFIRGAHQEYRNASEKAVVDAMDAINCMQFK